MVLALRLLRLTAATVACILLFAALFQFFKAAPKSFLPLEILAYLGATRSDISLLGSVGWGVMFRGPGFVFWGTVPLLLIFLILELRRVRHVAVYGMVWTVAGFVSSGIEFGDALLSIASVSAGLIAGLAYWLLAGRSAGVWIDTLGNGKRFSGTAVVGGLGVLDLAAYAVLAFFALQLTGYLHYGAKLFWVSTLSEASPGVPPYKTGINGRDPGLSAFHKVALMDFPDPASCLKKDAGDLSPENLRKMDWDQIDNTAEAEVCIFRLLGSYEDMSHATAWLESQGFRVPDRWSSARPYKELNGDLRVTGGWSIREDGPKYPTAGIIRRLFYSIPYGMSVNATWSADGHTLQYVTVSFSTL